MGVPLVTPSPGISKGGAYGTLQLRGSQICRGAGKTPAKGFGLRHCNEPLGLADQ